jgi:Inner membrane component of T3SS, cytoplasmic domain
MVEVMDMDGDQSQHVGNAGAIASTLVPHLSVVGGFHAGAKLSLGDMPICVIGSAPHCDVILRDNAVAPEHLTVITRADGSIIRALGGPFMADGKVIAQGETIGVVDGMSIELGAARIQFGLGAIAKDSRARTEHARYAGGPEDVPGAKLPPPIGTTPAPASRALGRNAVIGLFSGGALLVAAAVGISAASNMRVSTKGNVVLLEQSLNLPQLAGITLKEKAGVVDISGFVSTEADKKLLADRLAPHAAQLTINNKVETGADIANRAKDSFRVSGVAATTHYVPHGKLTAEVKPADLANAAIAKDAVMKDLPMLRSIEVIALQAAIAPKEVPKCVNPAADREALKVKFVVSNEPAYIKTADGTMYYVEGQLPTGHIIKNITDSQLFLDCNGVSEVVTF